MQCRSYKGQKPPLYKKIHGGAPPFPVFLAMIIRLFGSKVLKPDNQSGTTVYVTGFLNLSLSTILGISIRVGSGPGMVGFTATMNHSLVVNIIKKNGDFDLSVYNYEKIFSDPFSSFEIQIPEANIPAGLEKLYSSGDLLTDRITEAIDTQHVNLDYWPDFWAQITKRPMECYYSNIEPRTPFNVRNFSVSWVNIPKTNYALYAAGVGSTLALLGLGSLLWGGSTGASRSWRKNEKLTQEGEVDAKMKKLAQGIGATHRVEYR